jgi:hypothetical protein
MSKRKTWFYVSVNHICDCKLPLTQSVYEVVVFEKRQFQSTIKAKQRFIVDCLTSSRNFINMLLAAALNYYEQPF